MKNGLHKTAEIRMLAMLPANVQEISVTPMGFAALVQPQFKEKVVPIFIGPSEAYAISSILQNEKTERPVGADLMRTLIDATGSKVEKIFINDFHNGTFFARIYLSGQSFPDGKCEIDARPSDAIALAVRFATPIYIAEHVYDRTAIDSDTLREANPSDFELEDSNDVDEILTADERETFFEAIMEEFGERKKIALETKSTAIEQIKLFSRGEVLEQMLRTALKQENYEEAACIRDEIRLLAQPQS